MANHAYVIPKGKMPSPEQINQDAQEIVKRKFPQFTLTFQPPEQVGKDGVHWHLHAEPDDGYLGLIFWLGEYGDPATYNEEDGTWGRMLPCIEFRHGHAFRFLWWVEYEIREELACRYNAYSVDDGCDGCDGNTPSKERYENYRDYLVKGRWEQIKADHEWRSFVNAELNRERDCLEDKYKPLLGENIENV